MSVVARDRSIVRRIADLVEYDNREDYRVRYNYRMSALTAAVGRGRVWGTQFHPEKSSRAGMRLLRNFIEGPQC